MGWDATGDRVELGQTETVEPRTVLIGITWTAQTRTVTVARAEWRGLTKAAAQGKSATVGGWVIIDRPRVDDSAQWQVQEELTTYGAWS